MKSILVGTVAAAALAAPALAAPDRLEQSSACDAMAAGARFECMQQLRTDDPHRASDSTTNAAPVGDVSGSAVSSGINGSSGVAASRTIGVGSGEDNSNSRSSIGDAADEAGESIGEAADEAGDAIGNAADEVGDEIGDAF